MNAKAFTYRIRLSTARTDGGRVWNVYVAGDHQAVFAGDNGKNRALDYALRQAELLRKRGSVIVVVDGADDLPRIAPSTARVLTNSLRASTPA